VPDLFELMEHQHVLADRWIEDLRQRDVEVFDLRPKLLASRERLFWSKDFHLNLKGQALVAEALEEVLAPKVAALISGSGSETAAEGDSDSPK
jgi:lysophospholipase L1-like esterase